ncbi:hypothetical protein C1H46_042926 [Malus baccata]|uniref:Uncharacterized protein n=1 Tax=Malus baccata TaxID=106549 RepID=A0A540KBE8_MALBA|nr:hypothetical protein C1H46_042926 [Malus baccata]
MRRLLIGSGFVKIADLLGSVVTVFDKELVRLLILKDCRFFFKLSRWTGLDVMELGPDGLLGLYNHSMMNTVRVELTKSISPDLNWKVSKGYRSSSRRSRKPVDKNQKLGAELAEKSARSASEATVSESEKGVAVCGRRLGDKIEHVPIKKRRLMVRSPSPPPHLEDNKPLLDGRHSSGHKSCATSVGKKHPTRSDTSTLTRVSHNIAGSGVIENLNEVTNQKPGDVDDFFGIEILAAAACNNSINDDINHAVKNQVGEDSSRDAKDASTSARPLEQTTNASTSSTVMRTASEFSEARDASVSAILEESSASLETVRSSPKDVRREDKVGSSSFEADGINTTKAQDEAEARSSSSKDVRFHWDLNVGIDAWEEPCDMGIADPQTTAADDISMDNKQGGANFQASEANEIPKEEDAKNDIASTVKKPMSDNEEEGLKACPEFELSYGKCVSTDNALGSSKDSDSGSSAKASSEDASVDACIDRSPCDIAVTCPVSEETDRTPISSFPVKHMTGDTASGELLGETVCSESVKVENPALACVPEGAPCEIEGTVLDEDGKCSGATSSVHDDPESPEETKGVESCQSLSPVLLDVKPVAKAEDVAIHHSKLDVKPVAKTEDVAVHHSKLDVQPVAKTEDVAIHHSKHDSNDKSASGASVGEGRSLVTVIAKEPVEAASDTHTVDSLPNDGSAEVVHKSSGNPMMNPAATAGSSLEQCHYGEGTSRSSGRATEDPSSDVYDLNTRQDDNDHMVGEGNTKEPEAGYDSQYEDGELRESDVPYWEENEIDDLEVECVDYGSDTCDSEAADDSVSGKVGMELECRETELFGESRKINSNMKLVRGLSPGSDNTCEKNEHALRQCSVGSKTKTSGSDQLPGDSEASSNRTAEAIEGCTVRRHAVNSFDCHDAKHSPANVVGSMASDSSNKMGTECARRRRLGNFDSIRSEEAGSDQSMGREKSDSRMQGKSFGGVVNSSGSYWDSKRRESPTYRGSFGSGRSRPRIVVENHGYEMESDVTFSDAAGVHNRVRRQAITFSSNRSYHPAFRRSSPSERNDAHNIHRGMIPMRDTSPDRRRFRRYPQGVNRGIREEYHRPIPDDPNECSYNVPRRMPRREQSTSPPGRGPIYYSRSYQKPQSRCRSRSPLGWGLPRERNDISRHRGSRSPDYRFDSNMELRVPFQRQNFGGKYDVGFVSPPKRRFSPQQNSRWFDDSHRGVDHNFRGGRFAGRRFQPGQRFDSERSSRRLNQDGYSEPVMRPARYSELPSGGRECRYEGSDDDRRKPDGRYEIVHRVRRFDSDGGVRQYRYDEDRFASHNTQNYDESDHRAAERRPREAYVGEVAKRRVN